MREYHLMRTLWYRKQKVILKDRRFHAPHCEEHIGELRANHGIVPTLATRGVHGTRGASVRDRDWKLVRFFEDGHEELYSLKKDIRETRNLAESEPAKRAELSAKLTAWQKEIEACATAHGGALIPEPNPDYVPRPGRKPSGHFGE